MDDVVSIISMRAEEKNLKLNVLDERDNKRRLLGDPSRLRQILLNLCSNAIKFTESGTITLTVWSAPSFTANIEDLYISVRDTGIGIAPEKMDTIFEKFV